MTGTLRLRRRDTEQIGDRCVPVFIRVRSLRRPAPTLTIVPDQRRDDRRLRVCGRLSSSVFRAPIRGRGNDRRREQRLLGWIKVLPQLVAFVGDTITLHVDRVAFTSGTISGLVHGCIVLGSRSSASRGPDRRSWLASERAGPRVALPGRVARPGLTPGRSDGDGEPMDHTSTGKRLTNGTRAQRLPSPAVSPACIRASPMSTTA